MNASPLVSIVMPAFNEEPNISRMEQALNQVVEGLPYRFEFLVVEGGSTDATPALLRSLCERDRRWGYIELTRKFSIEASLTAGYAYARGDAIIVLYSDLQEPPELIPEFLDKWREGYDSVYGVQVGREGEWRARGWLVQRAYRLIERWSEVGIPAGACDFRLITREVRDALLQCGERVRYLRGLIPWLGYRQTAVTYVRKERVAGESQASPALLVQYLLNGLMGFSMRPLRLIGLAAVALLGLAGLAALVALVLLLAGGTVPLGLWIGSGVAALLGVNLIALWVVGEYVGRTHTESLRRPLYVVRETVNVDPLEKGSGNQTHAGQGNHEPSAPGD